MLNVCVSNSLQFAKNMSRYIAWTCTGTLSYRVQKRWSVCRKADIMTVFLNIAAEYIAKSAKINDIKRFRL